MKARILGGAIMILGALLIVTPWVIFPVCGVGRYAMEGGHHGMTPPCHQTLKAETALGAAVIVVGLVPLFWPGRRPALAASGLIAVAAVLAVAFPAGLTSMCKMPSMPCLAGTYPALIVMAALLGATALAGAVGFYKVQE
jgi:hypothetical protein